MSARIRAPAAPQVEDFLTKNSETMETQTRQMLQAPGLGFLLGTLDATPDAFQDPPGGASRGGGGFAPQGNGLSRAVSGGMEAPAAGAKPPLRSGRSAANGLGGSSGDVTVGKVATSTGKRFLRDMSRLMSQLSASSAHFVHCVKPNGMEQVRAGLGQLNTRRPEGDPKESPKGDPKESANESPRRRPKGEPQGEPKETQRRPEGDPKESPKGDPKESRSRAPRRAPMRAPKESPKGEPQRRPEGEPQRRAPKESPKGDPKESPKGEPQGEPQ